MQFYYLILIKVLQQTLTGTVLEKNIWKTMSPEIDAPRVSAEGAVWGKVLRDVFSPQPTRGSGKAS